MKEARHSGSARLTQADVAAALARHEMLYSGRIGGARATFAFCDLSGLDLSGRNLCDADFTGAVLEDTNFVSARLDAASFFGADLESAIIRFCLCLQHTSANLSASRSPSIRT